MATTSIHIEPIKPGTEAHNKREKELGYVRKDLSRLNETWEVDTVSNRLAEIKAKYNQATGQQMQKKATPIREGVIVIGKQTSMDQIKNFARKCETQFGIRAFQIHIHRDEGHHKAKEWKENLHAHILFDWTDLQTGKSIKLNRQQMADMQTLTAETLSMERGKSSDVKHLNAVQFKIEQEQKRAEKLIEQIQEAAQELKNIKLKESAKNSLFKASERFGELMGKTRNDIEKEGLKKALTEANERAVRAEKLAEASDIEAGTWKCRFNEASREKTVLQEKLTKIRQETKTLFNSFEPKVQQVVKRELPEMFLECLVLPPKQEQEQNLKQSGGMKR